MRILVLLLFLLPLIAHAETGVVTHVVDGDTVIVQLPAGQVTVRLYGIDCPELSQPYGKKARARISELLQGKPVEVLDQGQDDYGRTVAVLALSKSDESTVQALLLKDGLTWVYPYFCRLPVCEAWESLEQSAKAARRGLWRDKKLVPPWVWRKNNK